VASVTDPEVSEFLAAGTRTGKLSYTGADGRPLVVPVWFIVEDGCIVFNTGKDTAPPRWWPTSTSSGDRHPLPVNLSS
jgi:nitroimidazol reductase NimA-like FMN-containing flavoprotein (pyridoxamine 5'-phosphate oxidase superfamily)